MADPNVATTVEEAEQITGLLVHLAPFANDPSIMYLLHAPAARVRHKGPQAKVVLNPAELDSCRRWRAVLVDRPAIFALTVVPELEIPNDMSAPCAWEMSSSAKDGTDKPAVAGHSTASHGPWRSSPKTWSAAPNLDSCARIPRNRRQLQNIRPANPDGHRHSGHVRLDHRSMCAAACAHANAAAPQGALDDPRFKRLSPTPSSATSSARPRAPLTKVTRLRRRRRIHLRRAPGQVRRHRAVAGSRSAPRAAPRAGRRPTSRRLRPFRRRRPYRRGRDARTTRRAQARDRSALA